MDELLDDLFEEEKVLECLDVSELIYPSVVLSGITIEQELEILSKSKQTKGVSLPLFVEFNNKAKRIGYIDLTLSSILDYKILGLNKYKLTLYKSETDFKVLDIDDPNTLIKFIKL